MKKFNLLAATALTRCVRRSGLGPGPGRLAGSQVSPSAATPATTDQTVPQPTSIRITAKSS